MSKYISEDFETIISLASSSASLAKTPETDSWIEAAGGNLPPYVRKLARGIMKSGKTLSQAIAIAISRIKRWAAGGGGVTAKTQAKAAKALAQWEALKAKNKSRKAVKLTAPTGEFTIVLSDVDSYKLSDVERAWYSLQSRELPELADEDETPWERFYLKEVWSDFIIVGSHGDLDLYKIPYFVDATTGVTFEDPVAVRDSFEEIEEEDLDEEELQLLEDVLQSDD